MGTQDSLVHIEAATLAGGDNNQDRYAYGDGWAFVLDGASSFSETPPVHDGGWYAERLKNALATQLAAYTQVPISDLVAEAIRVASADHDSATQGPCPTSTVALARWGQDHLELYVLGDSYAAVVTSTGKVPILLEDSRIEGIGSNLRESYRHRLAAGQGFDSEHRDLLAELQAAQVAARNRNDGYWIAGDEPMAAFQGISLNASPLPASALLYSDGLTDAASPRDVSAVLSAGCGLESYLTGLHRLEERDFSARNNPRAKLHDDKTLMRIIFNRRDPS